METTKDMLEYLKDNHTTEAQAIRARSLRELFNLGDKQVRNVVSVLRQNGEPICSSSNGYWYSTDPDDIEKTLHRMEAQVSNMQIAIQGLRKALGGKNEIYN